MGVPENDDRIRFEQYRDETQLVHIQGLIDADLSEPYTVFTYRYFVNQWPNLCFLAMDGDECVGCIVCKLEHTVKKVYRGYIAMLAVRKDRRKKGLGSELVCRAIVEMHNNSCEEVVLEAEESNRGALRLYENLGFIRAKRLEKYYLNGSNAFRLKLSL
mmetsp:Transcript_5057/g.15161  ORF Transcript_5057/g.15161 Transcript_5057/m.15161 type:complete len:159 (-) Transcript_5057:1553-2029(-)